MWNLDFNEARDIEWQWHQLGHMQICTLLQTNNHASNPPLSFFTGRMPFLPPNQQRQSTEGIQPYSTHTRLMALFPGVPGWAGTRKVKPIWILLEQETVGGSGISWAICKSAPRFRRITTPAPHHSVFYRPDALPATQPTASKHWRQTAIQQSINISYRQAHSSKPTARGHMGQTNTVSFNRTCFAYYVGDATNKSTG